MTVKCPNCGKATVYDALNKYRPFCCERCATLDLGAWADEKYRVPTNANADEDSNTVNELSDTETCEHFESPPRSQLN